MAAAINLVDDDALPSTVEMDFKAKPNYVNHSQLLNVMPWATFCIRGDHPQRTPLEGHVFADPSGVKWRLKLFPPKYNADNQKHVALFVECIPNQNLNQGWYRTVHYRVQVRPLGVESPFPTPPESKGEGVVAAAGGSANPFPKMGDQHTYRKGEDRGFWRFLACDDGEVGLWGPNLRGDVQEFWVDVELCDYVPPPPYDSKKATGMVGLKNQGATCYMNSLLQSLFHCNKLRAAVYKMPTEDEQENAEKAETLALALQRVFWRLQTSKTAVSTKELTRAFGWDSQDAFMQQDVQELNRKLCEKLEEKMKGTVVDGTIKHLFEGKVRSFIRCLNVPYESTREESFYDISLDVKGCGDLTDSFAKYVEVERLDGDNKYEANDEEKNIKFGKQDAEKGVRFVSFPPVLNLQLKRFDYDPMADAMVKINDRFEFPERLDLSPFLAHDIPPPQPETNGAADAPASAGASAAPESPGSGAASGSSSSNAMGGASSSGAGSSGGGSSGGGGGSGGGGDGMGGDVNEHVYLLHSVLVHSGDVHGGHYYAYIRPQEGFAKSEQVEKETKERGAKESASTPVDEAAQAYALVKEATAAGGGDDAIAAACAAALKLPQATVTLPPPPAVDERGQYFRFDDDMVSKATTYEATEAAYGASPARNVHNMNNNNGGGHGGSSPIGTAQQAAGRRRKGATTSWSSAYMLVYVKESVLNDLMVPFKDADIPQHLTKRFKQEEEERLAQVAMKKDAHKFMEVVVSTSLAVAENDRYTIAQDFVNNNVNGATASLNNPQTGQHYLKVRKESTVWEFMVKVEEELGVPISRQRLWNMEQRENKTKRVGDFCVLLEHLGEHVSCIHPDSDASNFKPDAEEGGDNGKKNNKNNNTTIQANKLHVFLEVLDEGGEEVDGADFEGVRIFDEAREQELRKLYEDKKEGVEKAGGVGTADALLPNSAMRDEEVGGKDGEAVVVSKSGKAAAEAAAAGGGGGVGGGGVMWDEDSVRAAMCPYTLLQKEYALIFFKAYNPLSPRRYATATTTDKVDEVCKEKKGGEDDEAELKKREGPTKKAKVEEGGVEEEEKGNGSDEKSNGGEKKNSDEPKKEGEDDDEEEEEEELPLRLYVEGAPLRGADRELAFVGSAYVRLDLSTEDLEPLLRTFHQQQQQPSAATTTAPLLGDDHRHTPTRNATAAVAAAAAEAGAASPASSSDEHPRLRVWDEVGTDDVRPLGKGQETLRSHDLQCGDILVFQEPRHNENGEEEEEEEEGEEEVVEASGNNKEEVEEGSDEDAVLDVTPSPKKDDDQKTEAAAAAEKALLNKDVLLPLPGVPLPLPAKAKDYFRRRLLRRVVRFYPVSPLEPVVVSASSSSASSSAVAPFSRSSSPFTQGWTGGFDLELTRESMTLEQVLFAIANALLTTTNPRTTTAKSTAPPGDGAGGRGGGGGGPFEQGDFHGDQWGTTAAANEQQTRWLAQHLRLYSPQNEPSAEGYPQPCALPIVMSSGKMHLPAQNFVIRTDTLRQFGFNSLFYEVMPFSYDELRGNAVVEMVVTHHTHALDIGLGQRWRDPSPPQQQPGVGGGGEGTVDVALLGSAKGTAGAAVGEDAQEDAAGNVLEKPSSPSTASEGDSRGDEESDQFYRLPVLHTYRDEQGQAKLQTALYRHSDANATATCVIQALVSTQDPVNENVFLAAVKALLKVTDPLVLRCTEIISHKMSRFVTGDPAYELRPVYSSVSQLAGHFATINAAGSGGGASNAHGPGSVGGMYGYGYGGALGVFRSCLEVFGSEHEDEFHASRKRHEHLGHIKHICNGNQQPIRNPPHQFGVQVVLFSLPRGQKRLLQSLMEKREEGGDVPGQGFGPVEYLGLAHFTFIGPSDGLFEVAQRVQTRINPLLRLTKCRPAVISAENTNLSFVLTDEEATMAPWAGVGDGTSEIPAGFDGTPIYKRLQRLWDFGESKNNYYAKTQSVPIIGFEVEATTQPKPKTKRRRRAEGGIQINC